MRQQRYGAPVGPESDQREPEGQRLHDLSTDPFVGLMLAEAENLAASQGRFIRVLDALDQPRHADLVFARVNVELDEQGQVAGADAD